MLLLHTGKKAAIFRSEVFSFSRFLIFWLSLFLLILPSLAQADNYALIIGGLAQDKLYYDSFWNAASGLHNILATEYGYSADNIIFLFEDEGREAGLVDGKSDAEHIKSAFGQLQTRVQEKDKVVIFMVGHANSRGGIIMFNLPKRDISDSEYAVMFNSINCKDMIVVLAFPHSGSFIKPLSKPGRVIITSSSAREGYAGEFSRIFIEALADNATDANEDDAISLLETFLYTQTKVKEWYEADGSVQSEHPHLDDNGDGNGSRGELPNDDEGLLAQDTFFGKRIATTVAESQPLEDFDIAAILKDAPNNDDYPDASAVVLLETETLDINEDISYEYSTRRIVKIINEKGKKFGSVSIPYTVGNDDINLQHARTMLPDGRVVDLDPRHIHKNIPPPEAVEAGLFVAARLMRFDMPEMTDNCIIDYAYSVNRVGHIMKGEYWRQTYFQTSEPVLKYRFTVRAPKTKELLYHINGMELHPTITETKYARVYEFESENVPPIQEEKFMPSLRDLACSISISSLNSWEQLARWYYTLIREQDHATPEMQKKTEQLLSGVRNRREKIRRLYEYVATNVRYVGIELGIWAIKPHAAGDVFKEGYGDCKDKATLLNTMLTVAGIKSYPVLISAGDSREVIREVPSLSYFNHMILVVEENGDFLWLDPTVETCAFGDLPPSDQNRWAFIVVDEENSHFQKSPTFPAENNLKRIKTDIKVQTDLSIAVQEEVMLKGCFNTETRAKLEHITPDNHDKFLREFIEMDARAQTEDFKIFNLENMNEPLRITVNYRCDDYIVPVGGAYLLEIPMIEHPYAALLSEANRSHPVVIGKNLTLKHEIHIRIPETFIIQSVPNNKAIATNLGEITVKYKRSKDTVVMTQQFILHQPIFDVQQVSQLKQLVSLASSDKTKYIMLVGNR